GRRAGLRLRDAAVRALAVADHVVGGALAGVHRLRGPAEQLAVERPSGVDVRRLELVPGQAARLVHASGADRLGRLPDAQGGAGPILHERHAPGLQDVEGLLDQAGAQFLRLRRRLVGARDGDIAVPVGRRLVGRGRDRADVVALDLAHRVRAAARDLVVLEVPTEQTAVEVLR